MFRQDDNRTLPLLVLSIILIALGSLCWRTDFKTIMAADCQPWQDWRHFKQHFISEGGRVIDTASARQQTVSEAQAYALFFALVANDRAIFDKLLAWTQNNLAQGDLTAHLPAWLWGKRDDGSWGVIDDNTASDADLWLAYALGEAGKHWQEPRYSALSTLIAGRVLRSEVAEIEHLGTVLLPGSRGFTEGTAGWRLNPSYLPPFLLKRLTLDYPDSPWQGIFDSSMRILSESANRGFAPDWLLYQPNGTFVADSQHPSLGGYDAIRVYLWVGMMSPKDPLRGELLLAFPGMAQHLAQFAVPPETVNIETGLPHGDGPSGFSAALLPYLSALNQFALLRSQLQRLQARPINDHTDNYYDHVLGLFGQGWQQQYFAFDLDGSLITHWERLCAS